MLLGGARMKISDKVKSMTTKKIKSRISKLKQSNAILPQAEIIVLMSELNTRGEYV